MDVERGGGLALTALINPASPRLKNEMMHGETICL
jgi:hypothetical protein